MARHLLAHPQFVHTYCRGVTSEVLKLVVWSDSHLADCRASRKSTSGGILAIGGGIAKLSNRQASIAMSSAATEALPAMSFLSDLGWNVQLTLNTDAEAARAIASRQGVGSIQPLEVREVRFVWLEAGTTCLSKVWEQTNLAAALTKPMTARETSELLERHAILVHSRFGVSETADDVRNQDGCESKRHRNESIET